MLNETHENIPGYHRLPAKPGRNRIPGETIPVGRAHDRAQRGEADLAVVNSCTVTAEAASDSRAAIRRAKRLGAGEVIVTGCWATLEPDKAAGLAGVTRIVPNQQKESLAADLLGLPQEFFELEPVARQPLPGLRKRTRAFIKVQDGCDNACTFCITTVARGSSSSRPVEEIVRDTILSQNGGARRSC